MNLVADCMETVAPNSSGCWLSGVAKVLSTATIAPGLRGAEHTTARSATVSSGLDGDSSHTRSDVAQAAAQAPVSAMSSRVRLQRFFEAPAAAIPATP